jgi:hypothetical protein
MYTVILGLIQFFFVLDIHKRSVNCQYVIVHQVHKAVTLCLPFIMFMGLMLEIDISEVRSHSLYAIPFINFSNSSSNSSNSSGGSYFKIIMSVD